MCRQTLICPAQPFVFNIPPKQINKTHPTERNFIKRNYWAAKCFSFCEQRLLVCVKRWYLLRINCMDLCWNIRKKNPLKCQKRNKLQFCLLFSDLSYFQGDSWLTGPWDLINQWSGSVWDKTVNTGNKVSEIHYPGSEGVGPKPNTYSLYHLKHLYPTGPGQVTSWSGDKRDTGII